MAFIETRIDSNVSIGFRAVAAYNTRVVTLDNGREKRNINWTKAKRRYQALYQKFSQATFDTLLAAFHAASGSANAFRFRDYADYNATLESLGVSPAGSTPVQLAKTYTLGAASTVRTITKPNSLGFTLYQAGVAKAGTLDTTTGLFTPTTAWTPAAALTWTGTFDVPVRFASDEFPIDYVQFQNLEVNVELVEVFGE